MPLKIKDEILTKYNTFYKIATGNFEDAVVLREITDENANEIATKHMDAKILVITQSTKLTNLAFIHRFKQAEYIALHGCAKATQLFDVSLCPVLKGLALVKCGKLCDFTSIGYTGTLLNIFIDSGVFNRTKIDSLSPIVRCKGLLTLDLAFSDISDKPKIDFDVVWPCLEALTISPNLRKYFITQGDKR